jgi:hypothetical protein
MDGHLPAEKQNSNSAAAPSVTGLCSQQAEMFVALPQPGDDKVVGFAS